MVFRLPTNHSRGASRWFLTAVVVLLVTALLSGGCTGISNGSNNGSNNGEIYGQYTGTMAATVINEDYLLSRNISSANTEMINEIYLNRNENFILGIKHGGIESGVPISFYFHKGEYPYVENSTRISLSIRNVSLLPNEFANYQDGREGDVTIIVEKNSFSLVKVETEEKDWVAIGAVYRLEGSLSGDKLTGTWSVEENGNTMFEGFFEADRP